MIAQEKHVMMLRNREYALIRAYIREIQFSRLMQETPEDEEHPGETVEHNESDVTSVKHKERSNSSSANTSIYAFKCSAFHH